MFATLREDIQTVFEKDPAARSWFEVLTCYPGLQALWMHRLAKWFWRRRLRWLGRFTSHVARFLTGIEIHPGATIGRRFFIDHGMGVVIGETAEVGDDVLMYKGAVLGGTTLNKGKRHPTIGNGVVIGSNAVVLGAITVGHNARIGSGAVVIKPVPADSTAVGVPAKVVRGPHIDKTPSIALQHAQLPDPIAEVYRVMDERIQDMEQELAALRARVESTAQTETMAEAAAGES